MRCFHALLIGMLATLAVAQVQANPGYTSNSLPATSILPSYSPLIATPIITSGASNGAGYNAAGASNGTGGNIVGATNATGDNIAGASNSTLELMSGAGGPPATIPPYMELMPSAAPAGELGFGAARQAPAEGPVFLERGAMLSDSAYDRFGSVPITLAEAAHLAKQRQHADKVRTYTNEDIERVRRQNMVTYRRD